MAARFLDTNVLLRYLTRDDERRALQALMLLSRVARGEEKVATSVRVQLGDGPA
jgi:predicted nucleic acid-binding protein